MKKYFIGMDDHIRTCSICVKDEEGEVVMSTTVPTDVKQLRRLISSLDGEIHMAVENGPRAAWLYHGLSDLCEEFLVANRKGDTRVRKNKSDLIDSSKLCDELRLKQIRPIYVHKKQEHVALLQASHVYEQIRSDSVRLKNRVVAVFTSVGIQKPYPDIYDPEKRKQWLALLKKGYRSRAELLLEELDAIEPIREKAKKDLIAAARKRKKEFKIILSLPGIGELFAARLMALIANPNRVKEKRKLWKLSGLAVVNQSSADFRTNPDTGEIILVQRNRTLGLNRDYNRRLKNIFKSAAKTAIQSEPMKTQYEKRIAEGQQANLVLLTIARKIAASFLACWQKGEMFDPERVISK